MPFRRRPDSFSIREFLRTLTKAKQKDSSNPAMSFTGQQKEDIRAEARKVVSQELMGGSNEGRAGGMFNVDPSGAETPGPIIRGASLFERFRNKFKRRKK